VTRSGPTDAALVVSLVSGDTSEATVPASVTIPAGQASASFSVAAVDDSLVDGTQQVTFTASAGGFVSGACQVSVTDNDVAVVLALTLSVQSSSFSEAAGASAAVGTVARSGPTDAVLVVSLVSGDTSEATVPASVTIPAGQASADFAVAAVDDSLVDGTQQVTFTASAGGFVAGSGQVTVTDNDITPPGDDYADPGQWSQAGEVPIDPGSGEGQVGGQIEEPSDGDLLKFVAAQDGVARIVVSPSAGNISPMVTVYDAAGNPVACNDRDPGAGFRAWVDLQAGETCYVEVQGGGGSGAYQVAIDTTPTASFRLGKFAGLPVTGYFSGSGGGIVTVSYAGAGMAEIFTAAGGGGIEAISVLGATTGSSLAIKTQSGAGHVTLGDVFVDGAIKGITAATADLAGRLEIDGSLGKLTLSDVSNSEIHIGPRSAGDARTETGIILGRVKDLRIVSDTPIKSIRAVEWLDTDSIEDIIQAPSVGAVTITGRKASAKSGQTALAGDLAAGMILSDATRKQTLGATKVAGSILKGNWRVAGNVGAISAKATSSAWSLYAAGSLNRLDSLGDLAGAVSATRIGAVGAKATLTASISAGATDAKGASLGVLKAGMVHNASVVSAGGVGKVLASCWEGGSISAGWIGSIKTAANARLGGDGGFNGDIALSGLWTPAGKAVLGSAMVAGDLGGQWNVAGSLGSLKVLGKADHARVQAAGAIGSIALGASDGSDFLAGVGGDKRHAEGPADFASAARIGAFRVTGLKMPSGTPLPRFVKDTNISAATIGTVALVNAESTGNGIYVRWSATGGEIKSVVHKDTQYPENNWSYPPEGLFTGPDILHFL
jgi:hypothetical protein